MNPKQLYSINEKKKKNTKKFLILFPTIFTQINQIMNKKDPKYFIQKMKRKIGRASCRERVSPRV